MSAEPQGYLEEEGKTGASTEHGPQTSSISIPGKSSEVTGLLMGWSRDPLLTGPLEWSGARSRSEPRCVLSRTHGLGM